VWSNVVASGIGLVIHAEFAIAERITGKRHEGRTSTAAASST
jgi:hypothetical protein